MRRLEVAGPLVLAAALAGCTSAAPLLPPGPLVVTVDVVQRDWHTELCLAPADLRGGLAALAGQFPGAQVLCFGFGERRYMMERDHGAAEMLASLLPSSAVVLVVPLAVPPAQAFDPAEVVVGLRVTRAGADNLAGFVWRSLRIGPDGGPVRLREGVTPGSVFYAASSSYHALATCNTWTATGLRAAGLPVNDAVIFVDDVMPQVRRAAAAQTGNATASPP